MRRIGSWSIDPGSLDSPLVVAHRGGSSAAPENTIAAFRKALEVGADAIEMDVRLTRDRRVVAMHDRRVDRTTTGNGPVGAFTLEQLKGMEAGSWFGQRYTGERVPTLEEVFDAVPQDFPLYIELKSRGPGALPLAARVVNVIRRYERWESTMVASFNPLAVVTLRMVEPRITRGYIWSRHHPLPMRARWFAPLAKPHWLAPDRDSLTEESLLRFHSQGKPVAAWDVDLGTDMGRLGEMGLDALVTDYPAELVSQKSSAYHEALRGVEPAQSL